jgi:hypothetical protein
MSRHKTIAPPRSSKVHHFTFNSFTLFCHLRDSSIRASSTRISLRTHARRLHRRFLYDYKTVDGTDKNPLEKQAPPRTDVIGVQLFGRFQIRNMICSERELLTALLSLSMWCHSTTIAMVNLDFDSRNRHPN